jgi:alkylated DNA repair dioxygenase AlkB|tara:strand:- start:33 stop:611 length:579 start_codon:yes stop_codon:yes gene_type:complete
MIKHIKHIFAEFEHGIDKWDDPRERMFEGTMVKGRPTRGFGDSTFNYAGKLYEPEPWTHKMQLIKVAAEDVASRVFDKEIKFTFCLCGFYPDDKGIPHHSDTVPTLDDVVVSLSFGAPRVFAWRTYQNNIKRHTNTSDVDFKENFIKDEKLYLLEHGDVIMFDGYSQMKATHAVPDLVGAEERVNLTFRSGL